jgi:trans-aconitate methyltransferase
MYQKESEENFDSWHQDDSRQMQRLTANSILSQWNFDFILDLGCGKGAFTHTLKKRNNEVIGLDISQTAVDIASSRFPDIRFDCMDINNVEQLNRFIQENRLEGGINSLVFIAECLSYLENWKNLINKLSRDIHYLMVTLYLPENPIGFVKSFSELEDVIQINYEALEIIEFKKSRFLIVFAKSKNYKDL